MNITKILVAIEITIQIKNVIANFESPEKNQKSKLSWIQRNHDPRLSTFRLIRCIRNTVVISKRSVILIFEQRFDNDISISLKVKSLFMQYEHCNYNNEKELIA